MGFLGTRTARQILFILAVASPGAWSAVPVQAKTVVVLDFTSQGTPRADVEEVAAILGRSLAASGRFRLVEPDRLSGISSEDSSASASWLGRSQAAMERFWPWARDSASERNQRQVCDDWDCALRIGRRLHVDRVVIGDLGIKDSEWVLTTRMLDVATSSPLLKTTFRTEKGLLDLMDRGVVVVASRYDSTEARLTSGLKRRPKEIRSPADTAQEAQLERDLRKWRPVVAVTGALCLGAFYGAGNLWDRHVRACAVPGNGGCKDPHRNLEFELLGAGAALGVVAIASTVVLVRDSQRLEALKSKSLLDVSWTPLLDPHGAVGLATRWEF